MARKYAADSLDLVASPWASDDLDAKGTASVDHPQSDGVAGAAEEAVEASSDRHESLRIEGTFHCTYAEFHCLLLESLPLSVVALNESLPKVAAVRMLAMETASMHLPAHLGVPPAV